jgi:hypothetical protein
MAGLIALALIYGPVKDLCSFEWQFAESAKCIHRKLTFAILLPLDDGRVLHRVDRD